MKWTVKLPNGTLHEVLGANPEEAAKFVEYALEAPTVPNQKLRLQVRRSGIGLQPKPPWQSVTLHSECAWTTCIRKR